MNPDRRPSHAIAGTYALAIARACARVAPLAIAALLASCGGSGGPGGDSTPTPAAPANPALELIGKDVDPSRVDTLACAAPLDPATPASTPAGTAVPAASARYPRAAGALRGWPSPASGFPETPADDATPLQLRADRAGGFVAAHMTATGGAMFAVGAQGDKRVLPLPYAPVFDVAADGTLWFVAGGLLSIGTRTGQVLALAPERGGAAPADGPLGSAPVGPVSLIAAGADHVYLLSEEGAPDLATQPPTGPTSRSLRRLTRLPAGGWTVQTVPLPADLQPNDVVSAMRVGPADALVLLLNQPFKRLVSRQTLWPGADQLRYEAAASVRVRDTAGTWSDQGTKPYTLDVTPNATHGYLTYRYDLDARDLGVDADGRTWVGGAGGVYTVDATAGWVLVASPRANTVDQLGRDGPLATAAFAGAAQLVPDRAGLTFYDGESCQIRRLEQGRLATLSGPMLAPVSFAGAGLLGLDASGALRVGYGDAASLRTPPQNGRYLALYGLATADPADPATTPVPIKALGTPIGAPDCHAGTSYWAGASRCTGVAPEAGGGHWLGLGTAGPIARVGTGVYTGLDTGAGTLVSATTSWPGILLGDAPSGPGGVHVDGTRLYVFGTMRTDPPVDAAAVLYHEVRLYQVDLASGIASPVAGKSIASPVFGGRKIDLSPVIGTPGGGPAFVQHRHDGGFWLSNGRELWRLDGAGTLRRVAGLAASGPAVDGTGDAASIGLASSLRVLPDDRLLVVDQGAHAVRLASDDGKVVTVLGRLNVAGLAPGPLPGGLDNPIDVLASGDDLYVTTLASPRLLRARGALD